MAHVNNNTSGATGTVPNTGFSGVCGNAPPNIPQFTAVGNSSVNVTFPFLPADIEPPFGIGQCFVHQGKPFGSGTAKDLGGSTLNQTWFIWHVDPVTFPVGGDPPTVGVVGDSVIWSIVPQNFNSSIQSSPENPQIPYWTSGNYTITDMNGSTVNKDGAASPKTSSSLVQLLAGVAVTALLFGAGSL